MSLPVQSVDMPDQYRTSLVLSLHLITPMCDSCILSRTFGLSCCGTMRVSSLNRGPEAKLTSSVNVQNSCMQVGTPVSWPSIQTHFSSCSRGSSDVASLNILFFPLKWVTGVFPPGDPLCACAGKHYSVHPLCEVLSLACK